MAKLLCDGFERLDVSPYTVLVFYSIDTSDEGWKEKILAAKADIWVPKKEAERQHYQLVLRKA